jgi:hypothetical protein
MTGIAVPILIWSSDVAPAACHLQAFGGPDLPGNECRRGAARAKERTQ